jgi:hypothetical protein
VRISVRIEGDLRQIIEEQRGELADAVRSGVEQASAGLQNDLRGQTRAAGLGGGLEKAWRLQVYPTGKRSTRPAGLVWSKATFLHDVFINGASMSGRMYVPTAQAMAMGFGRTTISRKGGTVPGGQLRRSAQVLSALQQLGAQNVYTINLPNGHQLVLYKPPGRKAAKPIPLFVIIFQSRLAPRIDWEGAVARAEADLGARVGAAVEALSG